MLDYIVSNMRVLAGPKMNPRDISGCSQNPSRITKSLRLEKI
jgi:hypothetical protein